MDFHLINSQFPSQYETAGVVGDDERTFDSRKPVVRKRQANPGTVEFYQIKSGNESGSGLDSAKRPSR